MARINLLPWREKLRAQKQREFGLIALLGVVITGAVLGYWHWYNEGLVDHQKKRNQYLEQQIKAVDKQLKEIRALAKTKKQLISRMKVVTDLQSSRPQIVHLFDELVSTLPEGIYLTQVVQRGSVVNVEGKAQSNARVSAYMRGIEASPWLTKPGLRVIEQRAAQSNADANFSLSMVQTMPKGQKAQ